MSLTATPADSDTGSDRVLREIEDRVLWLATAIVDHANRVRPNPGGPKVGGHQASSASMVTLLDGHPHTLAFLAGVRGVPATHLGVTAFGQSGDLDSVYRHHGLDVDSIVGAALDLVD